jgi:hypothetical protein
VFAELSATDVAEAFADLAAVYLSNEARRLEPRLVAGPRRSLGRDG